MRANQLIAPLVALLLVATVAAPAASSTAQDESYAGTNVTFDVQGSAIADYAVHGDTVMESVAVQSQSEVESNAGVGVGGDPGAVADLSGADLSVDARAETRATVSAESGAELHAHDNSHGILVVEAGGESQYVRANLSATSNAERESDGRVVVTTGNGTSGAFMVVGDGNVTVTEEGDVAAELTEDARLVFRAYSDERDEDDRRQERMIANGTAAAEVHVMERDDEAVADTVEYGSDTTVEVTQETESAVTMTAERAEHEGRVVIASVSDAVLDAGQGLEVTVDGEAAVEASSYGELESAIGGDASKYLVRGDSSAAAESEVLVAVNHFSEREIRMSSSEDGTTPSDGTGSDSTDSDGTDDTQTTAVDGSDEAGTAADDGTDDPTTVSDGQPGFGAGVTLLAFALLGVVAALRRR